MVRSHDARARSHDRCGAITCPLAPYESVLDARPSFGVLTQFATAASLVTAHQGAFVRQGLSPPVTAAPAVSAPSFGLFADARRASKGGLPCPSGVCLNGPTSISLSTWLKNFWRRGAAVRLPMYLPSTRRR